MNPILRNFIAVIVGWMAGSIVNMGLVMTGHSILPIEGVDPNDMEALAAVMPTLGPKFLIFPFLAHALGTFVGALVAASIATTSKMKFAFGIGGLFLLGGIMLAIMLSGPIWFTCVDLIVAYIPMAYVAGKIAEKKAANKKEA